MNWMTAFLLLLLTVGINAQSKFGKVTKEELKQSKSSIDPEASAEIIFDIGNYKVEYTNYNNDFLTTKDIHVRIKIYDKDKAPDRLMKLAVPAYIINSRKEKILNMKAVTYNLIDGKIEKTKVNSNNIFTEEVNEYVEVDKLAFPNVKDGSILEYKYTIVSPRFFDLDTWYFQQDIPVKYSQFKVSYPDYFIYQKDRRGDLETRIETKNILSNGSNKKVVDILTYKNVPALRHEPFVQNLNNLKISIRYELSQFNNPGYGFKDFTSTWDRIIKDLGLSSSYGGQLKGNKFLDAEISQFEAIEDKNQKLEAIFQNVQQNYVWDYNYNLYPDNGTRKTFKNKIGNGTDINFILISMLRKAGFKANPIVLSTVSNGMLNYFPSKQKLNHTITGVVMNNEIYLMDPIVKFSKINLLPKEDLNLVGYMFTDEGKSLRVDLINQVISKDSHTINYALNDGVLTGKYINTRTNYFAMTDLTKKQDNESNFQEDYLSNLNVDVVDFEFKVNDTKDAIRYSMNFEDEKNYEEIGNKLLIKPLLFTATEANAFTFSNEERQYPLEFGTPFSSITNVIFEIPKGYEVESMPNDLRVLLKQDAGGYNISFSQKENQIIGQSILYMGYSILPQSFYMDVKNMFEQIIAIENQQIILKQK